VLTKSFLPPTLLIFNRKKIDAEAIRLSTRFDALDTRTQELLAALANTENELTLEMVDSVARMLCRMEAINQDEHRRTREIMAEMRTSLLPAPSSTDVITAQINMLNVSDKEEEELRNSVNKKILEDLSYPEMTKRYEDILEPHPKTFDWIFSDATQWKLPWSDFAKWLRDDGGIYWINGKAGSGKSTLMKHIYDSPRTAFYLREWSYTKSSVPCCAATYFFWNSGTNIQKSQEGLLRSLLFQILGEHTRLIPVVFPAQWAERYGGLLSLGQQIFPKPWSTLELHKAFERLINRKCYPMKI
jgi:hypothetical protein